MKKAEVVEWTGRTWKVLEAMYVEPDRRFRLDELKAKTGIDKAQLSRWLKVLKELGLVEHIAPGEKEDQRLKHFKLTWKGTVVASRILELLRELEKGEMKDKKRGEVKPGEVMLYLKEAERLIEAEETESTLRLLDVVKIWFRTYLEDLNFWNDEFKKFYDKIFAGLEAGEAELRLKSLKIVSVRTCGTLLSILVDAAYRGNAGARKYIVENMDRFFNAVFRLGADEISASSLIAVIIEHWGEGSLKRIESLLKKYPKEKLGRLVEGIEHNAVKLWRTCGVEAEKFFLKLLTHKEPVVSDSARRALFTINQNKIYETS